MQALAKPRFQRLALIGCGLMGGSFALAARQAGLVQSIVGFSASEQTRQRALQLRVIDQACASVAEARFYMEQTLEQGWSRDVLALQLKSNLYARAGKAVTNFSRTLPLPQSDLAQQTLKDPYIFDFMAMTAPFNERDVERQLTQHITQFLLELGKGFAFIGRQYHLEVAGNDCRCATP
jgi:predicted nuclease of restriction endonuclease-like (RecB) superfamily